MLPIEIVRKIMLYNIHPLAVVMKNHIIEHEEIEIAYLQEFGDELNESFYRHIQSEYWIQEPFMFLTKPVNCIFTRIWRSVISIFFKTYSRRVTIYVLNKTSR